MRCECGHDFAKAIVSGDTPHDSYAVIHDRDYPAFLQAEQAVAQKKDDVSSLAAIGRSSEYVGCMHECPECGRFLLIKPASSGQADDKVVLKREE